MITRSETHKIYAQLGMDLSLAEIIEHTADANDWEVNDSRNLTAHEWVMRWAKSDAFENGWNPSFSERLEYDFSQN